MKIAIPLAEGRLCMHFGHCEQFAVLDADPAAKTIASEERLDPPVHAPGVLPKWLAEEGVEVVIAGGMGRRAQDLFAQAGIEVRVGVGPEEPRTLVEDYLAGSLAEGQNVCDH